MITQQTLHLWPHIVQFSYVVYDNTTNTVLKTADYIIKIPDDIIISEENSKIHGITDIMSKTQGVNLTEVLIEFMEDYHKSDIIVAHNMEFDVNILKVELMRNIYNNLLPINEKETLEQNLKCLKISNKLCCTMQETIQLCNIKSVTKDGREFVKFPTLSELHKHLFNIIPKKLHNSLNDVLICLRCYYKLQYDIDLVTINDQISSGINHLIV
jgi:DNA polymerase III epsilon subunit-like protein